MADEYKHYVFQLINMTRKETMFRVTDLPIEQAVEMVAKEAQGPTKSWKKGDEVAWRAMTPPLHPESAEMYLKEFQSKKKPEFELLS